MSPRHDNTTALAAPSAPSATAGSIPARTRAPRPGPAPAEAPARDPASQSAHDPAAPAEAGQLPVDVGVFLLAAQFPGQGHAEALDRACSAAVAAEQAGLSDVWLAEHHFVPYGVCPSATTLAALLLGRTQRIGVGTAVSVLPNQHPVALGEQAALLHLTSGGRFTLGVGRGGPWVDLNVFGTGVDAFESGFPEALDLLLRWLRSSRVSADGPRYSFPEVAVVPQATEPPLPREGGSGDFPGPEYSGHLGVPALPGFQRRGGRSGRGLRGARLPRPRRPPQRPSAAGGAGGPGSGGPGGFGEQFAQGLAPGFAGIPAVPAPRLPDSAAELTDHRSGPPVLVACTSPASVKLAAERGLPILLGMHSGDEDKNEMLAAYRAAARAAGRSPEQIAAVEREHVAAGVAQVADSAADARRTLLKSMPDWFHHGLSAHRTVDGRERRMRDPHAYTELLCDLHAVGTPRYCADRLAATAERTGIRRFALLVEGSGDRSLTLRNVARLGGEVLPQLR